MKILARLYFVEVIYNCVLDGKSLIRAANAEKG